MGLLSLFKQKQETSDDHDNGEFRSRAEDDSVQARGRGKKTGNSRQAKLNDPVLPEKKRARRRLIGAVALVLAAVIGLPMILDSEPKPLADDISIKIPSKDKPASAALPEPLTPRGKPVPEPVEEIMETVPATSPAANATNPITPIVTPLAKSNPASTVAPLQDKAGKAEIKTEAGSLAKADKPEKSVAAALAKTPETPVGKSDSKPVSAEAAKPVASKAADGADEAARALAILEGKTPAKTASKPESGAKPAYVVQVAALATQEKVRELQDKLKAANIKSYTQKVATSSGEKTRVKVGPFESKEEADKMRAKLVKLGLNGTLISN